MNFQVLIKNVLRWIGLGGLVGLLSGSASAVFLIGLDWATNYRENHLWIIAFLPIAGFVIGWIYYQYGEKSVKGNNLLLEELYQSQTPIPLRMTPLVLFGTIFTHLFGGSAGREGTAVQMGGSLADQLTKLFSLNETDRRLILIAGVAGGFASVFGTPTRWGNFRIRMDASSWISMEIPVSCILDCIYCPLGLYVFMGSRPYGLFHPRSRSSYPNQFTLDYSCRYCLWIIGEIICPDYPFFFLINLQGGFPTLHLDRSLAD